MFKGHSAAGFGSVEPFYAGRDSTAIRLLCRSTAQFESIATRVFEIHGVIGGRIFRTKLRSFNVLCDTLGQHAGKLIDLGFSVAPECDSRGIGDMGPILNECDEFRFGVIPFSFEVNAVRCRSSHRKSQGRKYDAVEWLSLVQIPTRKSK